MEWKMIVYAVEATKIMWWRVV